MANSPSKRSVPPSGGGSPRESSIRTSKKSEFNTRSIAGSSMYGTSIISKTSTKTSHAHRQEPSSPQPKKCTGCTRTTVDSFLLDPNRHSADYHNKGTRHNSLQLQIAPPSMASELPLFPKANTMYLHSGNMINWNRLKRKPNMSSSDELCEVISHTLESYINSADKTELQYVTEIYKINTENVEVIEESERGDIKITVKLFICDSQPASVVAESLDKVLNELETTFVESLLLSISPSVSEDQEPEPVTLPTIQNYWQAMEDLVAKDKVLFLGICDMGKEGLESLYNWAQVKPCVNQVNLDSCCVLPKDLTEYAKAVNIQLLTHNDRPAFVTKESVQDKIQSVATERDSDAWSPEWVVRYSGLIKCRGIIKMKGYIFHANRDNRKRIL